MQHLFRKNTAKEKKAQLNRRHFNGDELARSRLKTKI
jgi:hypothetical protein